MLGMLESLINAFIDLDSDTQAQCRERAGLIVRVKAADPYAVFYVLFTDHGIELSTNSPGSARVRVGGSALALAGALLGGHGWMTVAAFMSGATKARSAGCSTCCANSISALRRNAGWANI